jgi:hypothetical protein
MRLEGLHRASITESPYAASASQHNYRPGPEPGESGLFKREGARGLLLLLIEVFARFPIQPVEGC